MMLVMMMMMMMLTTTTTAAIESDGQNHTKVFAQSIAKVFHLLKEEREYRFKILKKY